MFRAAFAKNAFSRFRKDEDGALIIFALILFFLMMTIGGVAVDFMRYEQRRTALQNTLDRGVLAAAALNQQLDPESVVRDYMVKAGLGGDINQIHVTDGLNGRTVSADGISNTDPIFLHLVGIDELKALGASGAEQRVNNIEIALVLDVSGSMQNNNKLVNLKAAANEFVDTVLASDPEGRISIALVPFNGQVNLGATLAGKYNLTNNPNVTDVNCVDLPGSVYSSTAMSTSTPMSMTAFADTFSGTNQTTSYVSYSDTNYGTPNPLNRWCPAIPGNTVLLPSKSTSGLHAAINGLTAIGATSINAGMKWGMALLDPNSQSMFGQLITAGKINPDFAGRPFAFGAAGTMKIVVLMTDGEHFAEERVGESYKSGNAPIYRATSDNNYSIFHASKVVSTNSTTICNSRPYWVPHLGAWHSRPWNGTTPNSSTCYVPGATFSGYTTLTWPQVWSNLRLSYVAWQFYARALGTSSSTRTTVYNDTMAAFRTQTPTTSMDSQLQQICGLAKDGGVTVYGIAFEAPTNGQTQIANCASSAGHYFNASGLQIATAFRTIATNITQLRLTQ